MTPAEWDKFKDEMFIEEFAGQADDFQIWFRLKDCCPLDYSRDSLERYFKEWSRSKRRGKHRDILDRKRRKKFGPGKFHAATSAGVFLNKNFVKGWRGINPKNP